jgi:uncharacterized membrane protein YeaQ/YmgE (transglycosylase-associated protein family)
MRPLTLADDLLSFQASLLYNLQCCIVFRVSSPFSTDVNRGDRMDPINILIWIIVGAIAGWLASIVMRTNRQQGLLQDIIVGIIGGFIGGILLNALGIGGGVTGINIGSIITAFIGAIVLIGLLRLLRRA